MSDVGDAAESMARALTLTETTIQELAHAVRAVEEAGALYEAAFSESSAIEVPMRSVRRVLESLDEASGWLGDVSRCLGSYESHALKAVDGSTGAQSGVVRPRSVTLTRPTRPRDPKAVPTGRPELDPRADRGKQVDLEYQDATAKTLAVEGYGTERLARRNDGQKNPDFDVGGHRFDSYLASLVKGF